MAVPPSSQQIAAALRYSPQTQQTIRRSEYLADALKQLSSEGAQNIQSPAELAAKLLATAILQRKSDKAKDAMGAAIKADQASEASALIAALRPKPQVPPAPATPPAPPAPPQDPAIAAPTVQNAPPPPPVQQAPLPPAQPQPQPQPSAAPAVPPEVDAIVRTVWGEARGEDPTGQAAVAGVILNRAKERGLDPRAVVMQPGQFEPWNNPETRAKMEALDPASPEYQAILQNIAPVFQGQNPVGGADHFYSPGAQSALGRPPPTWDNGKGQDLGRHRFFDLEQPQRGGGDFQFATGPAPAQPIQIAGALQPGMIPSAPGSSPTAGGTAPAAPQPQASAAGATPGPVTYQPTEQEIAFVERLLKDPRTFEQGRQEAFKLQQKMAQPVEWQNTTVNGLPAQVNPLTGELRMLSVPEGARTQTLAQAPAGLPPGTVAQQKPTGDLSIVYQPPAGFQGAPNQLQYTPGGPQDPAAGLNLLQGEGKLRDDYDKQIRDYAAAREGYQKVVAAAKGNTPADSIAMIFGVMKTLDPTSTVREGEYATVQNSGTIDQSVVNIYNRLLGGGAPLTPEQRSQFADMARRQFEVYQKSADSLNERYGQLAQSYGFDPRRVVREFAPIEPYKPQPTQGGGSAGGRVNDAQRTTILRMQQTGRWDNKAPLGSERNPFRPADDATVRAYDRPEYRGKHIILPNGDLAVID